MVRADQGDYENVLILLSQTTLTQSKVVLNRNVFYKNVLIWCQFHSPFAIRDSLFAIQFFFSSQTTCSSHIRYSPFAIRCSPFAKKIFNSFLPNSAIRYSLFAIRYSASFVTLTYPNWPLGHLFFSFSRANRESRMANREWQIANGE